MPMVQFPTLTSRATGQKRDKSRGVSSVSRRNSSPSFLTEPLSIGRGILTAGRGQLLRRLKFVPAWHPTIH